MKLESTRLPEEKALLVAQFTGEDENLQELNRLAETAGAIVMGEVIQRRALSSATLFGKGKVQEIKSFVDEAAIDVVICDNELSGSQLRNLTEALGVRVIDRSTLILDIFALRAKSLEGKLQVELAQLKYNLPRLIGVSGRVDRFGAGAIGMRGPGETKLETNKRVIYKQIDVLEQRLEKLKAQRSLRREKRLENREKTVALVGYTNSGKTSLMSVLSNSDVLPEDKLFATLDPLTRQVYVAENKKYLLTDTVGFIEKLPHEFIEAFSSTLEEARLADLLIHVVDLADKNYQKHADTVCDVLKKLEIDNKPTITALNKCDLAAFGREAMPGIAISAKTGEGIEKLKEEISRKLF